MHTTVPIITVSLAVSAASRDKKVKADSSNCQRMTANLPQIYLLIFPQIKIFGTKIVYSRQKNF